MSALRFTSEAASDLNDVHDYLAQRNPATAARVVQEFERVCRLLAQFPLMGARRDTLLPGMRSFPSGNYIIFYRPLDDGVEILRIVHGSRDLTGLFQAP